MGHIHVVYTYTHTLIVLIRLEDIKKLEEKKKSTRSAIESLPEPPSLVPKDRKIGSHSTTQVREK